MKHKKLFGLAALFLLAFAASGCGSKTAKESQTENTGSQSIETAAAEENPSAANAAPEVSEKTDTVMSAKEIQERLERFLADEEPVYFENRNISTSILKSDGTMDNIFDESKGYRITEMLKTFLDYEASLNDGSLELSSCRSGLIDCGLDGIPELCLEFGYMLPYGMRFQQMVIRESDGKLQLCYVQDYGYRTFANINRAGFTEQGGSVSAAEHLTEYGFLDVDGVFHYDYGLNVDYFNEAVEDAAEKFDETLPEDEHMRVECAYFDPAHELQIQYGGADSGIYTYYIVDESYNDSNDAAVYDDDSIWHRLAEASGLSFVKPNEQEAEIIAHEESIGVTDAIRNAGEISWEETDASIWKDIYPAAADPAEITADDIENNGGYFVRAAKYVYFHMPEDESMRTSALFGSFIDQPTGGTALMRLDLSTMQTEVAAYDAGFGPIGVSGEQLFYSNCGLTTAGDECEYLSEVPIGGNHETEVSTIGERLLRTDQEGRYLVSYKYCSDGTDGSDERGYYAFVYDGGSCIDTFYLGENCDPAGIADGKLYYLAGSSEDEELTLTEADLATGTKLELGTVSYHDDELGYGEITQFLTSGEKLAIVYSYFDGTGHFYSGSDLLQATAGKQNSLSGEQLAGRAEERITGPVCRFDEDGMLTEVSGLPMSSAVLDDTLGYYDAEGEFIGVRDGYGYSTQEDGTVVTVEHSELVNGRIFGIRNILEPDPENNIGWREAYRRASTEVFCVNIENGEETVLAKRSGTMN